MQPIQLPEPTPEPVVQIELPTYTGVLANVLDTLPEPQNSDFAAIDEKKHHDANINRVSQEVINASLIRAETGNDIDDTASVVSVYDGTTDCAALCAAVERDLKFNEEKEEVIAVQIKRIKRTYGSLNYTQKRKLRRQKEHLNLMALGRGEALIASKKERINFDSVGGCFEPKRRLKQAVDRLQDTLYSAMGGNPPKFILLYGPPGTGKSMLAEALAGTLECDFFSYAASNLMDRHVGGSAKAINDAFTNAAVAAEKSGIAVLFIDEVEALGGKRVVGAQGGGREINNATGALLVALSAFNLNNYKGTGRLFVICATNLLEALDPAFTRRFETIMVGMPTLEEAADILKTAVRKDAVNCNLRIDASLQNGWLDIAKKHTAKNPDALAEMARNAASIALDECVTKGTLVPILRLKHFDRFGTDLLQTEEKQAEQTQPRRRTRRRRTQTIQSHDNVTYSYLEYIRMSDDKLWQAVQNGRSLTVAKHLKAGYNMNDDMLYNACVRGHASVVNVLLKHPDIKVNKATNDGATPLYIACQKGHTEVVRLLLADQHIEVNRDRNGFTPLFIACQKDHTEAVRLLLADQRTEVNKATKNGVTPLYLACYYGHKEVVRLLLADQRIEVNKPTKNGVTPFYIACQNGHKEVVRLLLADQRIEVNKPTKNGVTPLFLACQNGHKEIVRLLLADQRIEVNKTNNDGATPFYLACQNGHKEIVRLLLADQRIEVNKPTKNGVTPLYLSCEKGHKEVVRLLLADQRVEVNKPNNNGATPFYIPCQNGRTEVVKLFLDDFHFDVNIKCNGTTPFQIAEQQGYTAIVDLINDFETQKARFKREEQEYAAALNAQLVQSQAEEVEEDDDDDDEKEEKSDELITPQQSGAATIAPLNSTNLTALNSQLTEEKSTVRHKRRDSLGLSTNPLAYINASDDGSNDGSNKTPIMLAQSKSVNIRTLP